MNLKLLLLMLIPSLLLIGISSATVCGVTPNYLPQTIVSCSPANIINNQGSATPVGMEFQITNFPSTCLVGNYVVYNSLNGQTVPTWCENNGTRRVWIQLFSNTIAGLTGANQIYYVGYASSSSSVFFGNTLAQIGEAPNSTGTYGQYDNGGNVFIQLYTDFLGVNAPAGWLAGDSAVIFNNGVTIPQGSASYNIASNTEVYSQNSLTDYYGYIFGAGGLFLESAQGSSFCDNVHVGYGVLISSGTTYALRNWVTVVCGTPQNVGSGSITTNQIMTISADNTQSYLVMAGSSTSTSSGFLATTDQFVGAYYGEVFQWIRNRASPPSLVYPTITFGSTQLTTSSTTSTSTTSTTTSTSTTSTSTTSTSTTSTMYPTFNGTQFVLGDFPIIPSFTLILSLGLVAILFRRTESLSVTGLLMFAILLTLYYVFLFVSTTIAQSFFNLLVSDGVITIILIIAEGLLGKR